MTRSRTYNSVLNFSSSIGGQLITIVMQFVVRTVFIHTLGEEYLGLNGLFTNILSMLSLAEMGVGTAIIYKLYEPVAKNDQHRIVVLMNFYKIVYRYIGLIIAVIGVILIPFLPFLIKNYDSLEQLHINAVLIYCLYLFNSISSYLFFAYKQAIIRANQKEYYITFIGYLITVGTGILQIICLLIFPNFILYVSIIIFSAIVQNILCARLADKKYAFVKDNIDEKLSKDESKNILKDCGALFLYKVNNIVVKSTDNIIISSFLGLTDVALYSNYYIFYMTIKNLFSKVFDSVGHSLGNLHTTHDTKHEYEVFESLMLVAAILGGTAFVGIYVVADEFIQTWLGKKWVIAQPFSLLLGIELFTVAFKTILSRYRTTMGLFQQAKFRPVAGMIINLGVSIALVMPLGITGVLVGTIVSDWTTILWYDPLVIHRIGFQNKYSVKRYYLKFMMYFLVSFAVGTLDLFFCKNVLVGFGWLSVIFHALICGISLPLVLLLISIKKQEGKYFIDLGKRILGSVKKKISKK